MIIYNTALAKRTFSLANTLNLFSPGLHALIILFICIFFYAIIFMDKHNSYFSSPKIWKNVIINSSLDEEYCSRLVRKFELKFFAGPPPKRFATRS